MLGRVATLHYLHGLTHQETADIVGISRVQVTRMLAKARQSGIVEIRVHSDEAIFPEMQIALNAKYGTYNTWIAPSFANPAATLDSIGTLAAECLNSLLKPGTTVAVGLSSTLASIAPHLEPDSVNVTFVPAIGGRPGTLGSVNPHEVAALLAEAVNGTTMHLPAPFLASSAKSAATMRAEPDVNHVLELARNADIGIFGLGGVAHGSGILVDTALSKESVERLLADGAVGDISASFFDRNGKHVEGPIDERIIALRLDEILNIPRRVGVAGGKNKVPAIAGAIAGGIITTLVTDFDTAKALIDY